MDNDQLAMMNLVELRNLLDAGEVRASEVTRALLERIETQDGRLHSYVALMAESAEREAAAADAARERGTAGPLCGVPVAVKDLCDAEGVPTSAGMPRVRADASPAARDATVVARLRAAGAVILGKLQLTEGAVAHHHPDIVVPINPHAPDYWSGASSSGTGVAVAAGLCYAGLGSDTGGSIRFPSFANGVTGLKPTWGRVSRAGVFPLSWSLDHVGPLARSAADCAVMLEVLAGPDPADQTAMNVPVPDYLAESGAGARGLRVGFDEHYASSQVDPATVSAMQAALGVLRDAGAEIVEVSMPDTSAVLDAWFPLATADAAAAHAAEYPARADDYGPGLAGLLDTGLATSGVDYALAHDVRQNFRGQLAVVFERADVVIAPAYMHQNLTVAAFQTFGEKETDWPELLRFTAPYDLSGTPTLSVPSGFNADGAPYGFQFLGRHLGEVDILRAGRAYQAATDWHQRPPRLSVDD